MKRIDIVYGGHTYSLGGADLEELKSEIIAGLSTGGHWLTVNDGEGMQREAMLLIGPGVDLALIPIPEGETAPANEMGEWTVQPAGSPQAPG